MSHLGSGMIAESYNQAFDSLNQHKMEEARTLVLKSASLMKKEGVKHVRLLVSASSATGDIILQTIEKHNVDVCFVGRR